MEPNTSPVGTQSTQEPSEAEKRLNIAKTSTNVSQTILDQFKPCPENYDTILDGDVRRYAHKLLPMQIASIVRNLAERHASLAVTAEREKLTAEFKGAESIHKSQIEVLRQRIAHLEKAHDEFKNARDNAANRVLQMEAQNNALRFSLENRVAPWPAVRLSVKSIAAMINVSVSRAERLVYGKVQCTAHEANLINKALGKQIFLQHHVKPLTAKQKEHQRMFADDSRSDSEKGIVTLITEVEQDLRKMQPVVYNATFDDMAYACDLRMVDKTFEEQQRDGDGQFLYWDLTHKASQEVVYTATGHAKDWKVIYDDKEISQSDMWRKLDALVTEEYKNSPQYAQRLAEGYTF